MTSTQKVIKYLAICLAIFITISIIGSIIAVVFRVFGFAHVFKYDNNKSSSETFYNTFSNIESMDITLDTANFNILTGNEFKVEAENVSNKFVCKQNGNNLVIDENENGFNFFGIIDNIGTKIDIYVPENYNFDEVKIHSGVGDTNINYLKTDSLNLKLGVGDFKGDKIESKTTEIKGGVGNLNIQNSKLSDMDLKSGVGNSRISGKITGKSKISAGVGNVSVDIDGRKSEYTLNTDSGIGDINVTESNTNSYNTENSMIPIHKLDVKGGIGSINVNFN